MHIEVELNLLHTKLQIYGIFCLKMNKKTKMEIQRIFLFSNVYSVSVLNRM